MPDPVEIVDYDVRWPLQFDAAARELRRVLGVWLVEIEHIGSTAVPGLAAKPVIDIQIGVTSLRHSAEIVAAMEATAYEYVPEFEADLPNRRYFRRWSPVGVRTHQVHLVERTDLEWWDRHVAFRDRLRSHPGDRDRYAAMKRHLADGLRHDRAGYTDAKSDFIGEIVAKARTRASGEQRPGRA